MWCYSEIMQSFGVIWFSKTIYASFYLGNQHKKHQSLGLLKKSTFLAGAGEINRRAVDV